MFSRNVDDSNIPIERESLHFHPIFNIAQFSKCQRSFMYVTHLLNGAFIFASKMDCVLSIHLSLREVFSLLKEDVDYSEVPSNKNEIVLFHWHRL